MRRRTISNEQQPPMTFRVNSTRNVNGTKTAMEAKHGPRVGSKDSIGKKQIGINRES
jgi:hypothetical protein